tara:strand:- start:1019 stop:2815 length:1797 start_codon:yes stop_codon:yes gene_type:complete
MTKNNDKMLPINFTSREFNSIRNELMGIVEKYYPDNFQDWSEASFGSMMIDAVAYVGDQLSFYLDYNVNESFLDTSYSLTNILRHGRVLGYKSPGRPSTYGEVALFIEIPANSTGLGPDRSYMPILKRGSRFKSQSGLNFILLENINFADSSNQVIVSKVDDSTGAPTHYGVKAYGNVVSGRFGLKEIKVGGYEKFRSISLNVPNLSEIISVRDIEGNEYHEVEHLSQDIIYKEIPNENYKNDNVASIMKPYLVSRKFVTIITNGNAVLQFGSGDLASSELVAAPQKVAIDTFGKDYVTDTTFDPTKLSKSKNYGIVPANTTLSVIYRETNPISSNLAALQLNKVSTATFDFSAFPNLASTKITDVRNSLEVMNETPIIGDNAYTNPSQVKQNVVDTFPTQNRAVTQTDYENIIYRMASKFGSIKRCSVQKDPDSLKRNLNAYVVSEDVYGNLIKTNKTIKNNLKTWLNHYRMVNDTIDILDPYIINLKIEFSVSTLPGTDKDIAMSKSLAAIKRYFSDGFFIGEHLQISDMYSVLKEIPEVLDVTRVVLFNAPGSQYSGISFSVNKNMSPNGAKLLCPKNAIFEFKYPEVDIKGKVV